MKYKEIINKMTLEEKASLMSGENFWNTKAIKRLGIPDMMLTDGPHGLRKQGGKADHLGLNKSLPATCLPTAATIANSWDIKLLEIAGELLGKEAAANNVSVLLGPGLNIKRNPLCGRNFEYFSEDPFLSGKLAAAMIKGIQSVGISACPKHFAVNSQETRRMSINEVVDERALREIYLEGFRYSVIEGKAKMLMTGYNLVNEVYANENMHLMQKILYGQWNYNGAVVTDWGGENDRVKGLIAGNQLEMPSTAGQTDKEIVQAIKNGELSESILDKSVNSLLTLIYDTKPALNKGKTYTDEKHHQMARMISRESIVLLKNHNKILPLKPKTSVGVIGDFADKPRYQGTGSSLINPTCVQGHLEALKEEELDIVGYAQGFKRFGGESKRLLNKALEVAKKSDVVLLYLGLPESHEGETIDRDNMLLPDNQIQLLDAISKVTKNIVLIFSGGSPVEMPWADKTTAIVHAYLGGQAVGGAVSDVLMGRFNPSGKLAETYPEKYEHVPMADKFPAYELSAEHRESIFVGYRYFDTVKKPVTWPFGHGLSYTDFEYGDLSFDDNKVSFTIKNIGLMEGAEISQVYVSKSESKIFRAEKELKGFAKIKLKPQEVKTVEILLDEHAFKYFNVKEDKWIEEAGQYKILVGGSSQDIRLTEVVNRIGEDAENPYDENYLPNYYKTNVNNITDKEFEILLGRPIPPHNWDENAPLGYNDTIQQGKYKKGFGRFLYKLVIFAQNIALLFGQRMAAKNIMFAIHLPYRQLARMTGGIIDMPMLDGILVMVNGEFKKGLKQTLNARRNKKKAEKSERNKAKSSRD